MRLLALLALLGSACITDRVIRDDGSVDEEVVARAKGDTERLRHLPFTRDVPLEVLTVAQLEEWLNRYYDDYKEALKKQDYFYHKMGILPPSRDSASTWKGFIGGFAGGVYDDDRVGPDGKKGTMILVQDYAWWSKIQLDMVGLMTGKDLAYEVFLAHELTHALQDQHFDLNALLDDVSNDDVRMVQKTVLESEANVMGMAHFTGMNLEDVATRKSFFAFLRYNNFFNAPILSAIAGKTPSFFSKQTFAQYELGLDWVEARLDDGEWALRVEGEGAGAAAGLALAYAKVPGTPGALPASTEQLLYGDKRGDPPLHVPPLPDGFVVGEAVFSSSDVFGALALKHWIEVPFSSADNVANGWGGDRYDVFVDKDDSPILLWRLWGDTDADAREIAVALRERFTRSLGAERLTVSVDDENSFEATIAVAAEEKKRVRTTRAERLRIEQRGAGVVVVNGVGEGVDLPALMDALFALAPAPVVEKKEEEAAKLQERLQLAFQAVPDPPAELLGDRLVLPPRTMAFRLGVSWWSFDDPALDDDEADFVLGDVEARWGMRENIELALPGSITVHTGSGPLQLAVAFAPASLPFLDPVNGRWSGRVASTITAQAPGVAGVVQIEEGAEFVFSDLDSGKRDLALRFGALLQPLPQLTLQPGVSFEDVASGDSFVVDSVRFGGVVTRGFVDAPLVELEVVPGLMAYWAASWGCRVDDGDVFAGVTLVDQRHALGLLMYF